MKAIVRCRKVFGDYTMKNITKNKGIFNHHNQCP